MLLGHLNVGALPPVYSKGALDVLAQSEFFCALCSRQSTKFTSNDLQQAVNVIGGKLGKVSIDPNLQYTRAIAFLGALLQFALEERGAVEFDSLLTNLVKQKECFWQQITINRAKDGTTEDQDKTVGLLNLTSTENGLPLEYLLTYGHFNRYTAKSDGTASMLKLLRLPALGVIKTSGGAVTFDPEHIVIGPSVSGHIAVYRMVAAVFNDSEVNLANLERQAVKIDFAVLQRIQ